MILYYDNRIEPICFGIEKLKTILKQKNIYFAERFLFDYTGMEKELLITVSFRDQIFPEKASPELAAEGFEIRKNGNRIHLLGADISGVMYALLDVAESISMHGAESISNKKKEPFLRKRGIKFNLPFEPYDMGDAMEKNIETCLDQTFWEKYIDFLAENRYNVLSLWSEHPFHMMVRTEKYPEACPFDDIKLTEYQKLFTFIIERCSQRGIEVFLITWNIRITTFVAKALGLPEQIGDMAAQYNQTSDYRNKIPNNSSSLYPVRQHLPVIKDYFRECIKTLLLAYPKLAGIGTNCAEEMAGDAYERQNWVTETYSEAVRESGRSVPFIMRTNMGNGKVATEFFKTYPHENNYISWKYSNAHMYSSTEPQFESLWNAWDGVDMSTVKVLYTVRNDDINTFRWGNFSYIRDYIRGMKKDYVEGFYWGADAYIWASDFQTAPHILKSWKYDFEKHWTEFWLLGRLGYDADEDQTKFEFCFDTHFGTWGTRLHRLLEQASLVIPAVNRQFWINYDFEWHPESLLSVFGLKTIIDFVNGKAMPGIGAISLSEYAAAVANNKTPESETPVLIKNKELENNTPVITIDTLHNVADALEKGLSELEKEIPDEYKTSELRSLLWDLWCWRYLASYYECKFAAALKLCMYKETRKESEKQDAVAILKDACGFYQNLTLYWSKQYIPYKMGRCKYTFGYGYYIADVEKDIFLAEAFQM